MKNYSIDDMEGIGQAYAEKLRSSGVKTVNRLLTLGRDPKGRSALAGSTGLSDDQILTWVNMADLYRVKGVGSEYAQLLHKAGVDTVKELRNRNPQNLHEKMRNVNASGQRIVRQLPSFHLVESWVDQAKRLEPMIIY
jgi:predicted flap endonuclease-1-like 5' DNA nuclease